MAPERRVAKRRCFPEPRGPSQWLLLFFLCHIARAIKESFDQGLVVGTHVLKRPSFIYLQTFNNLKREKMF